MNVQSRGACCAVLISFATLLSGCDLPEFMQNDASATTSKPPSAKSDVSTPAPRRVDASRRRVVLRGAAAPAAKTIAGLALAPPAQDSDLRAALQAAIDGASNGDIIELPTGRYLLSGEVDVPENRTLTIVGKGRWNEVDGTGTLLYLNQTAPAPDGTIMFNAKQGSNPTFSDFTIRGTPASFIDKAVGIKLSLASDFRITRMRVENFGRAGVDIQHSDTMPHGIVDHNEFYRNYKGDGQGLGYGVVVYAENKQWIPDPGFGSGNFIFVEDNHFDRHRHAIAAGGAGLYVARYNYMKDTFIASAIDAHESTPGAAPGTGNYYSTRAIEAYNNTIVNTLTKQLTAITSNTVDQNGSDSTLSQFGIGIRGGEALVHHNTISGYVYGGAIVDNYYKLRVDRTYPMVGQVGYLSGVSGGASHVGRDAVNGNGDFFYWANTFTPHPFTTVPWWYKGDQPYFNNYSKDAFLLSRDYHVSLAADATGTDYSFKPGYVPYVYPHPRTRLEIGVPLPHLSGPFASEFRWAVTLPQAVPSLTFSIKGGSGRAALYVRQASIPTTTSHYCATTTDPTRAPCVWQNAKAGTYYIMVRGQSDYSDATVNITTP